MNRIALAGYYALKCVQVWAIVAAIGLAAGLLAWPLSFVLPGGAATAFFVFMAMLFFAANAALGYGYLYRPTPLDSKAAYPEGDIS